MTTTAHLTKRERQILQLASEGLSNGEIAARLRLDRSTVASYFGRIYDRLGIRQSRAQAIYLYLRGYKNAA